jgi:hypothetical protein
MLAYGPETTLLSRVVREGIEALQAAIPPAGGTAS